MLAEDRTADIFKLVYLGHMAIGDPKNENQVNEKIGELFDVYEKNATSCRLVSMILPTISAPLSIEMRFDDGCGEDVLFDIHQIVYVVLGRTETVLSSCFAFTYAHAEPSSPCMRVHCFYGSAPIVVSNAIECFQLLFERSKASSLTIDSKQPEIFEFELNLEIRELIEDSTSSNNTNDNSTQYVTVPRHKNAFKLRRDLKKKIILTIKPQWSSDCLRINSCFAMFISPGRNVRHADMQLLQDVSMIAPDSNENSGIYVISASWDAREAVFALLNQETAPEVGFQYMTMAADLMLHKVKEPVRFLIETKIRVFPNGERYWYYTKKMITKHFCLRMMKIDTDEKEGPFSYRFLSMDSSEEIEKPISNQKMSLTLQLAANLAALGISSKGSTSSGNGCRNDLVSPAAEMEDLEMNGEEDISLLSGFGQVSKSCSDSELDAWGEVLRNWNPNGVQPKNLASLVRLGIPEALRGEIWQRLCGAVSQQDEIIETYKLLIGRESVDDKVILRDIHRTFPAHDFFKEAGGKGQESLYRISKAFSIYDSEIGYCQGQSFFIAALLLQMPEEQAFAVLVRVMEHMSLRELFRENFEHLTKCFYQLDRLIEAAWPDLWKHFCETGIASHMYASQWFLTLFTAKFPLYLVFRVLDMYFLCGFDSVFMVALAILKESKKDLLQLDFEGEMRYFRVVIPKRYRDENQAKRLMAVAINMKLKKLNKYEKEWNALKEAEKMKEDPIVRYERQCKILLSENMRLDTENDNLARQLVNSKIEMRKEIDILEDKLDGLEKELSVKHTTLTDVIEENARLEGETERLKLLLKREVENLERELTLQTKIGQEYKTICSTLSDKLERANLAERLQTPIIGNGDDNERITHLELELAQTKLALVESVCKNQELLHFSSSEPTKISSTKWFSKTLNSIKDSALMVTAANNMDQNDAKKSSVHNCSDQPLNDK